MYRPLAAVGFVLIALLCSGAVFAADWQYTGNSVIGKDPTAMFFDADSVQHPSKGTVRVWVKAISQKVLERYYEKHGSEKWYIENVARKIASGYVPAFFMLPSIKKLYSKPKPNGQKLDDLIIDVTGEEFLANSGDLPERAKFYFEIDCKGKRMATLSATLYRADGSMSNAADYESPKYAHVAPDSTGEWTWLLVCHDH